MRHRGILSTIVIIGGALAVLLLLDPRASFSIGR